MKGANSWKSVYVFEEQEIRKKGLWRNKELAISQLEDFADKF